MPNVENLNLEAAGIKWNPKGVDVDKYLLTSNKDVFAVGDCLEGPKFTHNSDSHARMVIRNALFFGSADMTKVILPYCTYTEPEIASVGLSEKQLDAQGIQFDTYSKSFDHNDRALCESRQGVYKIRCKKGTD